VAVVVGREWGSKEDAGGRGIVVGMIVEMVVGIIVGVR
jgi:hypothetical protein